MRNAGRVRDEIGPVGGLGRCRGSRHDLVVFGTIGIGEHVEMAVALFDVVLPLGHARRDQSRHIAAVADQIELGRLVVVNVDDDVAAAQRFAHTDEEAGVRFLIDDRIVGLRRAENMAAHAIGRWLSSSST